MNGLQSSLGESMNVVVEKRLAELQKEYEKMRTTWVDPDQHHKIEKELSQCRTELVLTRRVCSYEMCL